MEVYNPYSIVQVSEVLDELIIHFGGSVAYRGRAVVVSLVNTGLTAIVSVTLIDGWHELDNIALVPGAVGEAAKSFVEDWSTRFHIQPGYQLAVNELRAFLADVSRWVEQVDLSESLPKNDGQLRADVFDELADPLIARTNFFIGKLEEEVLTVSDELAAVHRSFAQTALHPLMLRAPFVFRTYTKPLGYAGDYQMVIQMLDEPRKGPSTYFQMVNAAFLGNVLAAAHRNRIDILEAFLVRMADAARKSGKPFRVLNIGCGPAIEIQRFIRNYPNPEYLSFELVDFNEETLNWTRTQLSGIIAETGKQVVINYVHDSVHDLLKRRTTREKAKPEFEAVYCAGLFDYLSDKVCARLTSLFASRTQPGGTVLFTNVRADNGTKFVMEHLLEWYLVYRSMDTLSPLIPPQAKTKNVYADDTGMNIFAEAVIE